MGLRRYGHALDVALLAACVYLFVQHPGVARVRQVGFFPALQSLPTRLPVTNASGVFIPRDRAPTAGELSAQEWFNYVLGSDLGSSPCVEAHDFFEMNAWKNSLILPSAVRAALPHVLAIWLRNILAGWALYYIVGGLWGLWIYYFAVSYHFPKSEGMPPWEDIRQQMRVSSVAMVFYSLAPTLGEWLIERGWTYTYHDLAHVAGSFGGVGGLAGGLVGYALGLAVYMLFVVRACRARPCRVCSTMPACLWSCAGSVSPPSSDCRRENPTTTATRSLSRARAGVGHLLDSPLLAHQSDALQAATQNTCACGFHARCTRVCAHGEGGERDAKNVRSRNR